MNQFIRSLPVFLIILLVVPVFSQDDPRSKGLKRITNNSNRQWNFRTDYEVDIAIEAAIDEAMRSVEVALERLEVNIPPIEVNLRGLENIGTDLIRLENLVEIDDFEWNDDCEKNKNKNKNKEKDKVKDKSKEKDDKAKGLKKIN